MPNSYNYTDSSSMDAMNRAGDALDDSPFGKIKAQFWNAKQNIKCKLGCKEDDHLVASDAELDAKLQAYESVKRNCENLLRCIERYQDYICDLSQEENALGRFLKTQGKADKTQAGKIMAAVGRAQSYTAQQRLALRMPLVRLYQELDVFTDRAITDCQLTVEKTEELRTQYRGSLLWMKNVTQQLDPEGGRRQMNKFRDVQQYVKLNKQKFDRVKLDCLQKIDLLSASRCNLFSQVLAIYASSLLAFWDRTVKAYNVITDSFKGHQYYEFKILKSLTDPSLKPEVGQEAKEIPEKTDTTENELITLAQESTESGTLLRSESMENFFKDSPESEKPTDFTNIKDELKDIFSNSHHNRATSKPLIPSATSSCDSTKPLMDQTSDTLMDVFDENDFSGQNFVSATPVLDSTSFSSQWESAFGADKNSLYLPLHKSNNLGDNNLEALMPLSKKVQGSSMLPSDLLDLNWSSAAGMMKESSSSKSIPGKVANNDPNAKLTANKASNKNKKDWLNLFSDVDPLQNPEAFGKALGSSGDGC